MEMAIQKFTAHFFFFGGYNKSIYRKEDKIAHQIECEDKRAFVHAIVVATSPLHCWHVVRIKIKSTEEEEKNP